MGQFDLVVLTNEDKSKAIKIVEFSLEQALILQSCGDFDNLEEIKD